MMYEFDSQTLNTWGVSATRLEMAWVRTAEGLRMQWTRASVEVQPTVFEIDAVRHTQPALAA